MRPADFEGGSDRHPALRNFTLATPTRLFENPALEAIPNDLPFDVSADGRRFIVAEPVGEAPTPAIHVVENCYQEFRDREQAKPPESNYIALVRR